MYASTNGRRIGHIRDARSNSGDDVETRYEPKKTESKVDHTGNFVIVLLVSVVVVCGMLWYSHSLRMAREAGRGKHEGVVLPKIVVEQVKSPVHEIPHTDVSHLHFKTNSEDLPSQKTHQIHNPPKVEQVHASLLKHASTADHTTNQQAPKASSILSPNSNSAKVDWVGCVDTIPDRISASEVSDKLHRNAPYDYNRRHIVQAPLGPVTLVCCNTTKGPLNIEVHPHWAPNGAKRFLDMVLFMLLACT